MGAGPGSGGRVRKTIRHAAAGALPGAQGSPRRGRGRRAQLLGRVPFPRLHRGGESGPGDVRPRRQRGFGCFGHVGRRSGGWTGVRRLRGGNDHPRGTGGRSAARHSADGARDGAERVRIGAAIIRVHRAGSRGPCVDSCRGRGRGVGGDPVGASGGSRGLRHRQRAEAGVSPVAGSGAHLRQPPDGVRERDTRRYGRRGRGRGAEQPDRGGLHRRQPGLPEARWPIRGTGKARYSERRRDGGGASGCGLPDPGAGRSQEDRPGVGRKGAAGRDEAPGGGKSCSPSFTAGGRWPKRERH